MSLSTSTHEGYFCDNLRDDSHPNMPINVISFSQAEDSRWGITYHNTMREFIVRTHAGKKLVFSKCEGLYICDMTTQVYRNLRAQCDGGVELFVGTYKNTDNWMLEARLNTVNVHHHTLAAPAYPEMQQRDQYQEAID
jgi:hypothetical protein